MRSNAMILLALAVALAPVAASAQPARQPASSHAILTTEGSGQSQAKPDFARLTAAVSAKAQTLDKAVQAEQDLVTRANSLLQSLGSEGLEIERSDFSLANDHPPYPKPDVPQVPSFTAMTSFQLKASHVDRLNDIIGKLAASGLFELHAVSFEVADTHPPLDEARRNAVADARHKAEILADAAGVRLDEIVTLTDGNAAPRVFAAPAAMQASAAVLMVPPATLNFSASVSISWGILPKP
jgi:uncharacterized protein YggE